MLAYSDAASTPGGTTARVESTGKPMAEGIQQGISHGFTAYMIGKQKEQISANIQNTDADTNKKKVETTLTSWLADKAASDAIQAGVSAGNVDRINTALDQQIEKTRAEINNLIADNKLKGLDAQQKEQLIKLIVEQARVDLNLSQQQIPGAKAEAEMWNTLSSEGKIAEYARKFLPLLRTPTIINRTNTSKR